MQTTVPPKRDIWTANGVKRAPIELPPDPCKEMSMYWVSGKDDTYNIVPVQANREEPEPFVTRRATENTCEPRTLAISEAENADPSESRRNVLGEPLPDKYADEHAPEELDALFLQEDTLAAVHGIEELDGGDRLRVDSPGGVHQELPSHSGQAVSNQLRSNESEGQILVRGKQEAYHVDNIREYSDRSVGLDVVIKVLGGEDGDGDRAV